MADKTLVTNASGSWQYLPAPYSGPPLAPGGSAVVTGSQAQVRANLGGEASSQAWHLHAANATELATHDGPLASQAPVAVPDMLGVFVATRDSSLTYQIDGEKSIFPIYVKSNMTQETPGAGGPSMIPGAYPGNDANDGLSPFRPITEFGLRKRFPAGFRDGARGRIKLAAVACEDGNNGFTGGVTGAPGYYQFDEIMGFGGGANYHGFTMSGPPKMVLSRNLGTATAQGVDGAGAASATIVTFGGASFNADELTQHNGFFRARNAAGQESMPIIPLFRHTATQFWICDQGDMNGAFDLAGTFDVVVPGALIYCRRDYDPVIRGSVSLRPGGLEKHGTDDDAQNPEPTFRCISFAGAQVMMDGASFHQCSFLEHPMIIMGHNVELKNCKTSGGIWVHGGSSRLFGWRNNTHGNNTNKEYGCYLDPLLGTVAAKYVGCDVLLCERSPGQLGIGLNIGGGSPYGGDELTYDRGHHSGQFKVYRGIYGNQLSTPLVYGSDHSSFSMLQYAVHFQRNVPVGIHVTDYAKAQINSARTFITGTNTANLRIGGDLQGGTTGDPQVDETLANFAGAGAGQHNKNWCIHRPLTPINYFAAGVPAAVIPAYGCHARIHE